MKYLSVNPAQTRKIGRELAKKLSGSLEKRALVIGLEGDLGGGKTTLLQGFAKGLGIKEKVLSPTFVIMKKFRIPGSKNSKFRHLYHVDCYRIKDSEEILDLGFKEIISDSKNIVVVEWADRIKKILPKDKVSIKFRFINKDNREISINLRK